MMLDHAGSESDEATTPAFREWVAGETYEDELEFAHCPDARIHGFRVVFYPYQVRREGGREGGRAGRMRWSLRIAPTRGFVAFVWYFIRIRTSSFPSSLPLFFLPLLLLPWKL